MYDTVSSCTDKNRGFLCPRSSYISSVRVASVRWFSFFLDVSLTRYRCFLLLSTHPQSTTIISKEDASERAGGRKFACTSWLNRGDAAVGNLVNKSNGGKCVEAENCLSRPTLNIKCSVVSCFCCRKCMVLEYNWPSAVFIKSPPAYGKISIISSVVYLCSYHIESSPCFKTQLEIKVANFPWHDFI